jgi:hypothetical protein
VVCDRAITQSVVIGAQYALSVSFSLRLIGARLADVPTWAGVAAPPQDVLSFLVSVDAADAFNISTSDVQVREIEAADCMNSNVGRCRGTHCRWRVEASHLF